jgi:AcrR family transcriptional regulator
MVHWAMAKARTNRTRGRTAFVSSEPVDAKRNLAEHAINTLARLGFAQTSLRDIAECSGLSVGVIHYHFKDKTDLVGYCTQLYKQEFVRSIDAAANGATTPDDVAKAFIESAVATVSSKKAAERHRLWYDIRGQAMFDSRFNVVLNEIEAALIAMSERLIARIVQTGGRPLNVTAIQFYTIIDGFFRFYLQRRLNGDPRAASDLREELKKMLQLMTQPKT